MQYDRFDDLITQKHGVIVKNWPLPQFRNPSVAATRIELGILFNSWESGKTQFLKLSEDEKRAWEKECFSSQVAMMSLPPPASIPTASSPTSDPTTPIPSSSTQPQGPVPPIPISAEMVLFSDLAEQNISRPASDDTGQGAASITPPNAQLPPPNPKMVAEIIRLDPTLQVIDPALIMAGVTQGFHHSAVAGQAESFGHSSPTPPVPRKKRNRGTFEIVTPELFSIRATKPPQNKRAKKNKHMAGRENVPPAEGTSQ